MQLETSSPAAAVRIETLSAPDELVAIEGVWDEFALSLARPSPFLTAGWLAERWRGLGLSGKIVLARRAERIVAALPLSVGQKRPRVGTFLSGPYAGVDLMLRQGEPDQTAVLVVSHLRELHLDYLELAGLSSSSVFGRVARLRPAPLRLAGAPSMTMTDGWDDAYRRQTSSKTRSHSRRQLAKLKEIGDVAFRVAHTPTELADAIEETFRIHDLRWSQRADPDLSNYTAHLAFHRRAVAALGRHGWVRVVMLELAGRPIAFNYYFAFAGTLFVHRLAFDPQYAEYSPGQLVTLHAIEHAASEGLSRVEFLRGEERYKLQLADHVEDVLWAACLPQTPYGRLASRSRALNLRLRQRAKSLEWLRLRYHGALKRRQRSRKLSEVSH